MLSDHRLCLHTAGTLALPDTDFAGHQFRVRNQHLSGLRRDRSVQDQLSEVRADRISLSVDCDQRAVSAVRHATNGQWAEVREHRRRHWARFNNLPHT